jgi:hypothetical protein
VAFGDADASTPAFVKANVAGKNATTASFTPPSGALLLAFAWHDTAGGNLTNTSVITDSLALTWAIQATRSKQSDGVGAANGHVQVSTAIATGLPMTVTTTGTNTGNPAGLYVRVITGADIVTPMDATPVEGTTNAAVVSTSIVTVTDGARAFLQVIDWNVAAAMTAGAGQTAVVSDAIGATDDRIYLGVTNAVTSPAGSTTLSTGSPSSGNTQNWIGVAVRPAAGGASKDISATVTTTVTVSPTAALVKPVTSTLTGTATISPTAALAKTPSASLTATATISPTAVLVKAPSATLTGTATISPTVAVDRPAAATLTATATVSPTVALDRPTSATLTATATITATASVTSAGVQDVSASLIATATITASLTVTTPGGGMPGEAHGPLPVAIGAITVHTYGIAGAVT